jgi:hypothetical protein
MARKIIYLAELQPYTPSGVTQLNFSDSLTDEAELGTTLPYRVRLTQGFGSEQGVFDDNIPGGTTVTVGSISLMNSDGALDALLDYNWDNRTAVIKKGYEGDPYASYTTLFTGYSLEAVQQGSLITIVLRDASIKLGDPLQSNKYLGTGGAEGFTDLAGKRKPLLYGYVRNAAPVLIESGLLIFQVHDGPIEGVHAVYDRGNSLTNGGDYADYNALAAAYVAPGFFVTCIAQGLIRLGAKIVGALTADVNGQYYTASVGNLAQMVNLVLQNKVGISAGSIDLTSVTALGVDAPYAFEGLYLPEPDALAQEFLETCMASMNAFWYLDSTGKIAMKQFRFRTPVATIREEDIAAITREQSPAQIYRVLTNYAKNSTVQSTSDFPIPRGTLNGYLKDSVLFVPTDASGNGGTYSYSGKMNAFFNDQDANLLGVVQFSEIPSVSWLTLAADGTFTVSDPGAATLTWSPYDTEGLPWYTKNKALYSRLFIKVWNTNLATLTGSYAASPDGKATGAARLQLQANAASYFQQAVPGPGFSTERSFSLFVKSNTGGTQTFRLKIDQTGGSSFVSPNLTATTSWQRFTVKATFSSGVAVATIGVIPGSAAGAADLLIWQADYYEGLNAPDGGPVIETISEGRNIADQGNGGYHFGLPSVTTIEARVGEYVVREDFRIVKRLSPATSTLVLTPSVRRFYLNDDGSQVTLGQTSVITATGTGLGTLVWSAVTNTGVEVTLTGSGTSRTLAAANIPASILTQYVIVKVTDTTNGISQKTKILVQRGSDAYAAASLGALAAVASSITFYYQDAAPTSGMVTDDVWIDTNDANKMYRYNGSSWVSISDTRIVDALTAAAGAQATADGKIKTYFSTSAPSGTHRQFRWVHNGRLPHDRHHHGRQLLSRQYGVQRFHLLRRIDERSELHSLRQCRRYVRLVYATAAGRRRDRWK